jgi:bifunctional non-homologous end joining protein LigD
VLYAALPLSSTREPFDHPEFVFELKWDGWRCIAHVSPVSVVLYSRRGNVYKRFDRLMADLKAAVRGECVLDGEIVSLDEQGRPQFYDILRRRGDPVFVAFDILNQNGHELRERPLLDRKRVLHKTVTPSGRVLHPQHIDTIGTALYERAWQLDLEGIVAKWKHAPVHVGGTGVPH